MINVRARSQRSKVKTIPYNGLECSLKADVHVQWVGTLEIDIEEEVPDNEVSGQGEGVFVDGMGPIVLWHKQKQNKNPYVFIMQMCLGIS